MSNYITTSTSISSCVYYILSTSYENKSIILSAYSIIDTSKLIINTLNKLGFFEIIRKKIVKNPDHIDVEINRSEIGDTGEFEIIEI